MKKIMVVDNDRIMLKLMTRLLEKEGYQVATAVDGLQALDMLKDYTPDVIIVDLIMPNIDGETLCKVIRNMENLKDVYLIILSGIAAEEEINITQLGVNACIAKGPFNETAKHILAILDQPVLSSSQCLSEEVTGINNVYPRGITEELLSAKRHSEMILEKITDGVLEVNSNGRIVFANSTALFLVDIPKELLLGAYFLELFAEDDRKRVTDLMENAKGQPQKISEDDPVYLNRYPVSLTILPLDEDGSTSIIIIKDLSEQKRTERALRKTNKFLKNILDSSFSISIVSTDLEQNILFWNKGAENIFGYKAEEVVGRQKIDIIYHEDEKKRIDNEIRPLIVKDKKSSSFEVREVTKDGRTLCMSLNLSPRFDDKGRVIGILGVGEDISNRKLAEQELIDSRKQLRDLSTYLQSVREQERTSIAREIHDDLGQVLTALKMDIRWLEKRLTTDQKPLLNKTGSMANLIDTGVERVQRIVSELRPGLLDDLGICAAVEWQLKDFEDRTGVKHEIAFDPQEITLAPDLSTTLFRIVQEALTNIARHANATMVKVSLTRKEDELLLTVTDNGKGITRQQISDPKAFGLLGMQERALYWNGKVTINGIQNKGTTISVLIPLRK